MSTSRSKSKLKEPVRVRTKKLANGSLSYYLDIYVDGKRHYEFLKLYWLPEANARIKEQNRATLAAVETIKSKRIIEITNNKAGIRNITGKSKILLSDWMQQYWDAQVKKGVRGTKLIGSSKRVLDLFIGKKKVRLADVDKNFCLAYIDWLRNTYKTAHGVSLTPRGMIGYIGYFRAALNAAVRAELIPENPFNTLSHVEKIKAPESKREFLTVQEVKTLIDTECSLPVVKQAYLFACCCGLRLSDVYALRWKDITIDGGQWRASVVMRKTRIPIFLPLSLNARRWMPERGDAGDEDKVFSALPYEDKVNKVLKQWAADAGITKHVTFHTSRHTFATMMLTLGADLYTTSKLLGHTNVQTTQIYAKIVDENKVAAINLIDKAFE